MLFTTGQVLTPTVWVKKETIVLKILPRLLRARRRFLINITIAGLLLQNKASHLQHLHRRLRALFVFKFCFVSQSRALPDVVSCGYHFKILAVSVMYILVQCEVLVV